MRHTSCMAERLTPRIPDLEVRGSSLARCVVSWGKELCSTLYFFTQVYKWVTATYRLGNSNTLKHCFTLVHANETRISSGRLGRWLMCAFTITTDCHTVVYLNNGLAFSLLVDLYWKTVVNLFFLTTFMSPKIFCKLRF